MGDMTQAEILAAIKTKTAENTKSKEAALSALEKLGIVNATGSVTDEYAREPSVRISSHQ